MRLTKEIYQRGEIVIASRLNQEFYDYATSAETLALNRISEALFDVINISTGPFSDVVANLKTITPIGDEVYAAKISQWLVLEVLGINRVYEDLEKFEGCMEIIARETINKIGSSSVAKAKFAIIIDKKYTIITDD